jgi:hypothetical protein
MFNLIRFNFLPMLRVTSVNRKRHPPCLWGENPRQCTHWDPEEIDVWDTAPKNMINIVLLHCKMNFENLKNRIVLELTIFFNSNIEFYFILFYLDYVLILKSNTIHFYFIFNYFFK